MRASIAGLLVFAAETGWSADYVELRRDATVYASPNKRSPVLAQLAPAAGEQPLLLRLVATDRSYGYYHVTLPDRTDRGWIYKTYVRRHPGPEPRYVPYKRSLYQHWIDEDRDCQDTRQEVLIRDAVAPVAFTGPRRCAVRRGEWLDPYTDMTFREPRQLDVDHVVPLKNAHESGGWAWSKERRREYANYLAYDQHLLAVKASENRRKADKGPDRYMPPDDAYRCDYVRTWVKIKRDWSLSMTSAEKSMVDSVLSGC
jgi:hypothetical protein